MKRNTAKKTDRKTIVAAQKNEKSRKGFRFRTGVKAGQTCMPPYCT